MTCHYHDDKGFSLEAETEIMSHAVKVTFTFDDDDDFCDELFVETNGYIISQCKILEEIVLHGCLNDDILLSALFQAEGPYKFPLKTLSMSENDIGPAGVAAICPFLKSREDLIHLNLECNGIGDEGAQLLAEALNEISVDRLNIKCNGLTSEGLSKVFSCRNAFNLKMLYLHDDFSLNEMICIARFLGNEVIQLKVLNITNEPQRKPERFCLEDLKRYEVLLESLRKNTRLHAIHINEYICLEGCSEDDEAAIFHRICYILTRLVCNTSSFNDFCQSNHTLCYLRIFNDNPSNPSVRHYHPFLVVSITRCGVYEFPQALKDAFEINAIPNISINSKIRNKLRNIYFRGDFEMLPFVEIKASLMPNVLEFVGHLDRMDYATSTGNLNGMYKFVRNWNAAELFSFRTSKSRTWKQIEYDRTNFNQNV